MGETGILDRWLGRVVQVRPGEGRALLWSFLYFFCLLGGYYVLRPLRDEMGVLGGTRNLPWMFTATFVTVLTVVPVFGTVVAKLPRRRFIPLVYNFFVANLALFWVLLTFDIGSVYVARAFFVWITVFSVFTVSVFWSFLADLFRTEQSKRLYGFIAAGGSLGTLVGPGITFLLAKPLGPVNLLIVAALLLEGAVFCASRLERASSTPAFARGEEGASDGTSSGAARLGGNPLAGVAMLFRSPYVGGISVWVFLLSTAFTFLYLTQAQVVAGVSDDTAERTRIFASIDFTAGLMNIVVQLFATGRVITRFGAGVTAGFLAVVFFVGYGLLAIAPSLVLVMAFQTVQRSATYALANPARETFFTVVSREEKYKAKNVIDGAVFRGADVVNSWLFAALQTGLGLAVSGIALVALPLMAAWGVLALWLGREQERRAALENANVLQRQGA